MNNTRLEWNDEDEAWFQAMKEEREYREIVSTAADGLGMIADDVLIAFLRSPEWQALKAEIRAKREKQS